MMMRGGRGDDEEGAEEGQEQAPTVLGKLGSARLFPAFAGFSQLLPAFPSFSRLFQAGRVFASLSIGIKGHCMASQIMQTSYKQQILHYLGAAGTNFPPPKNHYFSCGYFRAGPPHKNFSRHPSACLHCPHWFFCYAFEGKNRQIRM